MFLKWLGKVFSYYLCLLLGAFSFWTFRYFGTVSLEQVFSTLNFGVQGAFTVDSIYWQRLFDWCVLWPMVIAFFCGSVEFLVLRFWKVSFRYYLNLLLLSISIGFVIWEFDMIASINNQLHATEDYFHKTYINPKQIPFQAKNSKNLVLIYVESLENTYADEKIFSRNLLREFQQLHNVRTFSFSDYQQMSGTGWTIAGIVATQCALPLKTLIFNGNRFGENIKNFLPQAKCLGDILAEQGYKNVYLQGASLEFSGKGKFLKAHHYTEMHGKEEWLQAGFNPDQMSGWGLNDAELFTHAKTKLKELIDSKQRFNLTMLTVDMHDPMYLSSACQKQGYTGAEGIIECTTSEIVDFIRYIQKQGWMDQVNIVIVGDHLAMQNSLYDKLHLSNNRRIFNLFISQESYQKKRERIVHFDMLPTILDFINISYTDPRVGLGYSALRPLSSTAESQRFEEMRKKIAYESKTYNALWLEG